MYRTKKKINLKVLLRLVISIFSEIGTTLFFWNNLILFRVFPALQVYQALYDMYFIFHIYMSLLSLQSKMNMYGFYKNKRNNPSLNHLYPGDDHLICSNLPNHNRNRVHCCDLGKGHLLILQQCRNCLIEYKGLGQFLRNLPQFWSWFLHHLRSGDNNHRYQKSTCLCWNQNYRFHRQDGVNQDRLRSMKVLGKTLQNKVDWCTNNMFWVT